MKFKKNAKNVLALCELLFISIDINICTHIYAGACLSMQT